MLSSLDAPEGVRSNASIRLPASGHTLPESCMTTPELYARNSGGQALKHGLEQPPDLESGLAIDDQLSMQEKLLQSDFTWRLQSRLGMNTNCTSVT